MKTGSLILLREYFERLHLYHSFVYLLNHFQLFCDPVGCPWDFPGKNTGVGCHFLLQGVFLIQGSNPISHVSCIGCRFFSAEPHNITPSFYLFIFNPKECYVPCLPHIHVEGTTARCWTEAAINTFWVTSTQLSPRLPRGSRSLQEISQAGKDRGGTAQLAHHVRHQK